jgi:hypothetical protein
MTIEIPQEKWSEFFNDLSRRRLGWTTRVEVLNEDAGDQILSDGLPLNGVTFEEKAGRREIELSIGETADRHQTHVIANPLKVEFLRNGDFEGGVLEIEEESGTRTLVSLLNPMPVFVGYENYAIVMASSK